LSNIFVLSQKKGGDMFESFLQVANDNFAPLVLFVIPLAISPGPNNILLATSAANNGFKKTIPQILGIEFGFLFLILVGALGLDVVYDAFPKTQVVIKVLGVIYLFYLGIKIFKSKFKPIGSEVKSDFKPILFWEAFGFQFLNPKAFIIVSSMLGGFTIVGENYWGSVMLILIMVPLVGVPCISLWAFMGEHIKSYINREDRFKRFNYVMATLTFGSCFFII
jgi:threonine/homoserine/homoserine lactone efflux protein